MAAGTALDLPDRFGGYMIRTVITVAAYALLVCLYIISPFKRVRLMRMNEYRIGQLAQTVDPFIRKQQRDGKSKDLIIGVCKEPANQQLMTMFARHMTVIRSRMILSMMARPVLRDSPFVGEFPLPEPEDYALYQQPPTVSFTAVEESRGKAGLYAMGLPRGARFVCFHARDGQYETERFSPDQATLSTNVNCDIESFWLAMDYMTREGGYAIRMGASVNKHLRRSANDRIIDYATTARSDFMDIYLLAKCLFFVGSQCGLSSTASVFNTPVLYTNCCPFPLQPVGVDDMVMFKHFMLDGRGEMSLSELLSTPASGFFEAGQFALAGIQLVDNSPSEILASTEAMHARVNGCARHGGHAEEQRCLRAVIQPSDHLYNTPATIVLRTGRTLEGRQS